MDSSVLPFYSLTALTFLLLCGALFVVASRVLFQRRIDCPTRGSSADVLFEQVKRTPWSRGGVVDVARCSLIQGDKVDCPKTCLKCQIDAP